MRGKFFSRIFGLRTSHFFAKKLSLGLGTRVRLRRQSTSLRCPFHTFFSQFSHILHDRVCCVFARKISDDPEISECFDSSESEMESEDSGEDWGVIESEIVPYQDEPLTRSGFRRK